MKSINGQDQDMAFDAEQRRAALQKFMDREKLKIAPWEGAAKLGEGTLRKFMGGETKTLTDRSYEKLADGATELLDRTVNLYELQGTPQGHNGSGATGGKTGRISALHPTTKTSDQFVIPLVMWKMAYGDSGRQGAFVLSDEVVGEIPRPERVAKAKRAFSCKLLDNANAPGYRAGHVIVVDPDTGPIAGDLCIFTADPTSDGGADSVAAIFAGFDANHWFVTQNEVPGKQELSRKEYPQAWPVVVHYPHGS